MSLELVGVGSGGGDWSPSVISGLGAWWDCDDPTRRFQDAAKTVAAGISDPVRVLADRTANGCETVQGTDANRPTLVAWNAGREAAFIADATDVFSSNTAFQNLTNGVTGITACMVVEMPPTLDAAHTLYRVVTNSGGSKFNVYVDGSTDDKIYLQTRRVSADGVSTSSSPSTALTPGERYVVIISINYADAAYVIEVNGATTGQGVTGTATWATGATCEALNPNAAPTWLGGASAFTLGAGAELLLYTKALSSAERTQIRNYLNSKWSVY